MRVCTYNIHGGKDEARVPSLPQIAEALRESSADVILLQEVDRFLLRSGTQHQARILAQSLGDFHFRFYGRLRFGPLAFGNAILSRAPVAQTIHVPLRSSGGEPRCALGVRLHNDTTVWNTHLGLRDEWRREQLAALADALNTHTKPNGPVIVGGDFNARLDAPEVQEFLAQTGLFPVSDAALTFPNSAPAHRIDFLLGRNVTAFGAETRQGAGSDHCLLWAEVG